jgi:predicted DNA-binding protein (MmcQ/YjbR family)
MKCLITIDNDKINGTIIDLTTDLKYTNYRLNNITGEFASSVKTAYQDILNDIKEKCTTKELFIMPQSNRIATFIKDKYDVSPEFLWKEYPDFGIFRNYNNQKWFALVMNIPKEKIVKKSKGNVDVMNLKLDSKVNDILKIKGIYPAYHMNKKYWITVMLDDTLTDNEILDLVIKSYDNINKNK